MPSDGAACQPTSGTLRWEAVPGATGYFVDLRSGTCDHFKPSSTPVHVTTNAYDYAGLHADASYSWAVKSDCACGACSTCASFRTAADASSYPPPKLASPANLAKNIPSSGTLSWQGVPNAVGYRVQIGTACGTGAEQDVTAPSVPYSGLAEGTTHYWKVRARYDCGGLGSYSSCYSFTTDRVTGINRVYFPSDLAFARGQTHASIPVRVENLGLIEGGQITVELNPAVFTYRGCSLAGTRGDGGASLVGQLDASHTRVRFTLSYSATGSCPPSIPAGLGDLFDILVDVPATAPLGSTAIGLPSPAKLDACADHGTHSVSAVLQPGSARIAESVAVGDPPAESPEPGRLQLLAPFPNPARSGAMIRFSAPAAGRVIVTLYDIAGREAARIADEDFTAGWHELRWDGRGLNGVLLASGVYALRVSGGGQTRIQHMILIR